MEFSSPELRDRYALLIEGQCPYGHGPLERRGRWGACDTCGVGFAAQGETVSLIILDEDKCRGAFPRRGL
jgi:hypothetical protein